MIDKVAEFPSLDPRTGKLRPKHVPPSEDSATTEDLEKVQSQIDLIDGVFWAGDGPPSATWIAAVRASGKIPLDVKQVRKGEQVRPTLAPNFDLLFEVISFDPLTGAPKSSQVNVGNVRGKSGESAYEVAKRLGFTGTESQFLTSLKGVDGANVLPTNEAIEAILKSDSETGAGRYLKDLINQRGIGGKDYISVGNTNHTSEIQALINSAADKRQIAALEPGVYTASNLVIPEQTSLQGWGAGSARFGVTDYRYGAVYIRRPNGNTDPIITVVGAASGVENLTLDGRGQTGDGLVMQGFESRLDSIRLIGFSGTALDVQRANNTRWYDLFIDNSGTMAKPAVRIWSKEGVGHANETNTLDIYGLTIERTANVGLNIAYDPLNQSGQWAEFVRITNLHMESSSDSGGSQNTDAFIQVGNVRMLSLLQPFVYGGPGNLLEHRQTVYKGPTAGDGGIHLMGGMFFGASPSGPGGPSNTLIRLYTGDDFRATGTRFWRYAGAALSVNPTYGSRVVLDESSSFQGNPMYDNRANATDNFVRGNTVIQGQLKSSGYRPTVSGVSGVLNPTTLPTSTGLSGRIFFGTSDTPPSPGVVATVTFAKTFSSEPTVQLSAATPAAAQMGLHVSSTTTGFQIRAANPLPANQASTAYQINYMIVG